jgi:hypothetical protein
MPAGSGRELAALRSIPRAVREAEQHLSQHPLRGVVRAAEYAARVAATGQSRQVSAGFRGSVTARRQRFLAASKARAGDSAIWRLMTGQGGEATVFAIGDGYAGANARRGERVGRSRVKGLVRYLARFMRVVLVDEFRTSANCAACLAGKMVYARDRDGECSACGTKRNRDMNGCSLILEVVRSVLATGKRPAQLQRATDEPAGSTQ